MAERGKNGRIHVHAGIRAGYRLRYSAIIASWSAYLTGKGYTSATGTHRWHAGDEQGRGRNGFASARVCAAYLAKYLGKGFESDPRAKHEKRYRCTNVLVPEPTRMTGCTLVDVPDLLRDTFGGHIECRWYESANGDYGGWWFDVDP